MIYRSTIIPLKPSVFQHNTKTLLHSAATGQRLYRCIFFLTPQKKLRNVLAKNRKCITFPEFLLLLNEQH